MVFPFNKPLTLWVIENLTYFEILMTSFMSMAILLFQYEKHERMFHSGLFLMFGNESFFFCFYDFLLTKAIILRPIYKCFRNHYDPSMYYCNTLFFSIYTTKCRFLIWIVYCPRFKWCFRLWLFHSGIPLLPLFRTKIHIIGYIIFIVVSFSQRHTHLLSY